MSRHLLLPEQTADWKDVKTDQDPADIATRRLKPEELLDNQPWLHGPEFLRTGRAEPEVSITYPPEVLSGRKKVVNVAHEVLQ